MLFGIAIPIGCRFLNRSSPKRRAVWYRYPHRLLLAKQYSPSSVIVSERHIAERSNPVGGGRLVWIASPCGFAMTWDAP
ncbi:MAG: hypothetical protein LBT00_00825 [Spirochaetaceae bacterium]|nr:hypothetical protein [Spirochaetaceae bacterium]